MLAKIQPLLVTPRPMFGESMKGFLLRTSEANGYASPNDILTYAGLTENELQSVNPPLDKLARLYGRTAESLNALSYYQPDELGLNKGFGLLGHELYTTQLQIKNAKFCPDCVKETGKISVYWDIGYAVACPVHRRKPISQCPVCKKRVSWYRPGLLTCRCGTDLGGIESDEEVDPRMVGLMHILRAKLFKLTALNDEVNALKFPIEAFDKMSLRTYLALIDRFGKLGDQEKGITSRVGKEYRHVMTAAKALSDWPYGFYRFLESLKTSQSSEAKPSYFGLRKQFEGFYVAIFKTNLPRQEMEFLHEGFVMFGESYWKKATVDKRLYDKMSDAQPRLVGINEIAKKMGVNSSTVKQLVKMGVVSVTEVMKGNRKRLLFNATNGYPQRIKEGNSYTAREAARILGLPPNVLTALRPIGVFELQYLGTKTGSFHEYDIANFQKRMLNLKAKSEAGDEKDSITLKEVMRMKLGGAEQKAKLIQAIFQNEIQVIGRHGKEPIDIRLNRIAVLSWIQSAKVVAMHGLLVTETAKKLECCPTVIPYLVEEGFLRGVNGLSHTRIDEGSVEEFGKEYVSCAWVAKQTNSSTRGIVNRCKKLEISLLMARRQGRDSFQPFIRVGQLDKIGVSVEV